MLLALGSGMTFGIADFVGGLAAKRASAVSVTLVSQAVGLALLAALLGVLPGAPSGAAFSSGALAGLAGAGGLLAYLRALAIGPMGVVAPLASVVGVMLPVAVGIAAGERPSALAAVGIVLGLVAVSVVAGGGRRVEHPTTARVRAAPSIGMLDRLGGASTGPLLAAIGGAGFGVFFVLLDRTPDGSGLWPLVGARGSSLVMLVALLLITGSSLPSRATMPMVAASGVLDMGANILFLLAARSGLLTIAALLTSLYPVVVVVMARQFLAERLGRPQIASVALSLAAIAVITVA